MSGGRRTAMRVVLVVIAALVLLGTLAGLGVLAIGLSGSRLITDTAVLPTDLRQLTIDTGNVPVAVRLITEDEAPAPRVDLRMVTRADDPPLAVTVEADRSQLTLRDSGSEFLWFNATGEIKVVLPPDVGRLLSVTVNHSAGTLTSEADLDQLVAKSDDGTVTLGGSARLIDVDVRRGDVNTSTRIAVSESFTATAKSGNISVEFRAAPRTTEAIASGNVTVGMPRSEPYRVRTRSGPPDGETRVTVATTTDAGAPVVTARSESGNVQVIETR